MCPKLIYPYLNGSKIHPSSGWFSILLTKAKFRCCPPCSFSSKKVWFFKLMYFLPIKVKESLVLLRKIVSIQSNIFSYSSVSWFFCSVRIFLSTAYSFFQQWKQRLVLLALLAKLNKKHMASTNGLNVFFFFMLRGMYHKASMFYSLFSS